MSRFPQLARQPLLQNAGAVNADNRVWAKAVDLGIVYVATLLVSLGSRSAAVALAVVAWCLLDGFGRGQSPGKWLLGLHTIELRRGLKPDWKRGVLRNLPFAQITVGLLLPGVWGWILLAPGLAWIALETYFLYRIESGLRVGDLLGGTRVFDYKDEHTKFIEQFLKEPD